MATPVHLLNFSIRVSPQVSLKLRDSAVNACRTTSLGTLSPPILWMTGHDPKVLAPVDDLTLAGS
jgi:hypothetical protein